MNNYELYKENLKLNKKIGELYAELGKLREILYNEKHINYRLWCCRT